MDTQLKELVIQLKLLGWEFPFNFKGYSYVLIKPFNCLYRQGGRLDIMEPVLPHGYPALLEEVVEYINRRANE